MRHLSLAVAFFCWIGGPGENRDLDTTALPNYCI
jgi:hypothetical protein